MEDISMGPALPTLEQKMEWEYRNKTRELRIGRMRAAVVRKQITEAYEILERIRFDRLGDTAFRDKIVDARIGLELALGDFLLDDSYWKEHIEKHYKMTPKEYKEQVDRNSNEQNQPRVCTNEIPKAKLEETLKV